MKENLVECESSLVVPANAAIATQPDSVSKD